MSDLTWERLRDVVSYNPHTGVFTWAANRGGHVQRGRIAGHIGGNGYGTLMIDGVAYKTHRLAWLYIVRAWPSGHIDHIDGNPSNNRIANLRDASPRINSENRRKPRGDNGSGYQGVSWHGQQRKWQARITSVGRARSLGVFDTPAAAHEAYLVAKRQLHPGCTL